MSVELKKWELKKKGNNIEIYGNISTKSEQSKN